MFFLCSLHPLSFLGLGARASGPICTRHGLGPIQPCRGRSPHNPSWGTSWRKSQKNAAKKDKWMIDRWLMVDNYDDDYHYYDDDTFPTDPIETSATPEFRRPVTSPHLTLSERKIHFATTFSNHTPQKIPHPQEDGPNMFQLWGETTLDPLKGIYKGLSSPPPGCTPTFSTKYQNQGQDLRCYIQGTNPLKNMCVRKNKTYFQQYAWYTWIQIIGICIFHIQKKNKYIQLLHFPP